MEQKSTTADMKTLASCTNKLVLDGFTEDFRVVEKGLQSTQTEKIYDPSEVKITNFYRFEGASDPADNSILYAIEAEDGAKGTLVDAYGPYADPLVGKFIEQVEEMAKKPVHNDSSANR
jgi:hypothetical protein